MCYLISHLRGNESATGSWDSGPSLDGEGHFQYVEKPIPLASKPVLNPAPSYIHDTLPSVINGDDIPPHVC